MNYLIIGANAAGLSAAVRILKIDKTASVIILEKSDVVSFGSCGLPYYISGEFQDIEIMTARPLADFIKSGVDIRIFHEVIELNPHTKTVTARRSQSSNTQELDPAEILFFKYDKLLLATGAAPVKPPIKGLEQLMQPRLNHANEIKPQYVYHMHSKADGIAILAQLPNVKNVVIVGGGYIGVEAAEAFKAQHKNVTLIEFSARILEKTFDPQITQLLELELINAGINLQLSETVLEIENLDLNYDLQENQGNESDKITPTSRCNVITNKKSYPADLVIIATGFKPNTEFLKSTDIKLNILGAVIIDDYAQTNHADIFAAGDCATVPHRILGNVYIPLATSANKLGRLVGETMAGKPKAFIGTLGSCGIRVFDKEAGRTGITEAEAIQANIDFSTVFIQDKNHTDYVQPQTDMWVKLIYAKSSRKLLGGQICGSYLGGAVHRVDALAVAIYAGISVDELGFMDFIYAPPFARTWEIMNVAGNVAK